MHDLQIRLQAGGPTFDVPGEICFGLGVDLKRGTSAERASLLSGVMPALHCVLIARRVESTMALTVCGRIQ
jgi:hypothetical protein